MKHIVLLSLLLFSSFAAICQKKKQSDLIIRQDYGDVCLVDIWIDSTKDTLHITANNTINYIKIGDQVWEIKRTTSLEKIDPTPISSHWTYRGNIIFPQDSVTQTIYKF